MSPTKALEHILVGSPSVSAHRSRLQAATVSGGGSNELRISLVKNFSDSTDAVDAMLRAHVHADSEGVHQPVASPWCFHLVMISSSPHSIICYRYGGVWVAVVGNGFGSASDAGEHCSAFCTK